MKPLTTLKLFEQCFPSGNNFEISLSTFLCHSKNIALPHAILPATAQLKSFVCSWFGHILSHIHTHTQTLSGDQEGLMQIIATRICNVIFRNNCSWIEQYFSTQWIIQMLSRKSLIICFQSWEIKYITHRKQGWCIRIYLLRVEFYSAKVRKLQVVMTLVR